MMETGMSQEALEAASVLLEPPTPVKADSAVLAADLRTTVNNPEFSDVSFVCNDGVKVYASRIVLAARSPVLKTMLTNGMLETRLSEIPLGAIGSRALLPVLEYLYTGEILDTKLTIMSAFEVLRASMFLDIAILADYVFKILQQVLVKLDASSPLLPWCYSQVADISMDVKSFSRCSYAHMFISMVGNHLARLMRAIFVTSPSVLYSLSLDALHMFLRNTQSRNKTVISLMEYLRLRSTLLWAASKVSPEVEKKLHTFLPNDLELVEGFEKMLATLPSFGGDPKWLMPEEVQSQLNDTTWSILQVHCIHPKLLVKVLEPLQIIPPSVFLAALRFQVLRVEDEKMKWDDNSSAGYVVDGAGFMVWASARLTFTSGVARATMPLNKPRGTCEWDIFVDTLPIDKYMRIGIADALGQSTYMISNIPSYGVGERLQSDRFYEGFTVRVHVDMEARTCAFSINGRKSRVAFPKLPANELYPCVQMDIGCKARIQLVTDSMLI